jgi:hypothetical protein
MTFFIKCWAIGPHRLPFDAFLVDCDFEANDGMANFTLTNDPKRAKQFETAQEAVEYYRKIPKSRPIRDDGAPNRPLTAFSIEIGHFEPDLGNFGAPQGVLQ